MNVKKNQRSDLFSILIALSTTAGAIAGGRIGYKMARNAKIDKALGVDKISYQHYKVGRYWESVSSWKDCENDSHRIHTFKNVNNVISTFDGKNKLTHDNSASSVNISKYHRQACQLIIKMIKEKYGEEFLHKQIDIDRRAKS